MWQGVNRREFPRADYPCKIVVFQKGKKDSFTTHTENIGAGGVCVILEKQLEKFSPVELSLYLEDGQEPIECDARVVWVVKRERLFDLGVEFLDIKGKDVLRIERIVQECLKTQGSSS
jgi:c-di-GMP-binding flagellar brake protein YcgR